MKKKVLIVIIFFVANNTLAQNLNRQIEIEPYLRWDTYPQFSNAINVISNYKLDIKGNSWGINAAYKIHVKNNFSIKVGVGYFKYAFNKIESTNPSFGKGDRRVINYPTTLSLVLATDKYWYNTVCLNIGIEKYFTVKHHLLITTGITVKNYFTLSQEYHVPADNSFIPPALKIENDYKTSTKRYFGLGTEFNIGLLKRIGKVSIGPSLIIPIYDNWKQDQIFPTENNSGNRSKWFNGMGIGIICNYSLKNTINRLKSGI